MSCKIFCIIIFVGAVRGKILRIYFVNTFFHQFYFFGFGNQSDTCIKRKLLRIPAYNIITKRVIGVNINGRGKNTHFVYQTLFHFPCRSIRKCQTQNWWRVDAMREHIFNSVNDCKCFTGSRACKKHYWTV